MLREAPNILIIAFFLFKLLCVGYLSLVAQRVLSNEGVFLFLVSVLPSHLDWEPLRGRDHAPHSASAFSARNSAWLLQLLQADVQLTTRLNQTFCPRKFSIYSLHDVIGPL